MNDESVNWLEKCQEGDRREEEKLRKIRFITKKKKKVKTILFSAFLLLNRTKATHETMKTDRYIPVRKLSVKVTQLIFSFSFVQFDSLCPRQCPKKDQIIFILK